MTVNRLMLNVKASSVPGRESGICIVVLCVEEVLSNGENHKLRNFQILLVLLGGGGVATGTR